MAWKPDVCFFHHPCDDGFAAQTIVRERWPECECFGVQYGGAIPHPSVFDDKNLLIVDFSFRPDALEKIASFARSVVILDHHKTAEEDLRDVPALVVPAADEIAGDRTGAWAHFDMSKSGARLAWEFCNPGVAMPKFFRHIEDRDLWRFALPDTRPFSFWLRSLRMEFDVWQNARKRFDNDPGGAYQEGEAIERYVDLQLAHLVQTCVLRRFGKHEGVPVAYAPYVFASDLGGALLKEYPAAPFAAVCWHDQGVPNWSLRSTDDRLDVGAVAREFGGGGHRNASGFREPL